MRTMQYDWSLFLYQLQEQVKQQEVTIQQLEREVKKLKERSVLHVDKIEYKFDQLKVERLEGTLNIGINPSDIDNLEDLAVNGENPLTPYFFQNRELLVADIAQEVSAYMEKERPEILARASVEGPIDQQVADFVMQDIARQLPDRINTYLDQTPIYERTQERLPVVTERVIEKIKADIDHAVARFMEEQAQGKQTEKKGDT